MLLSKFPQFCGGLDKGLNNKPIVLFYNILDHLHIENTYHHIQFQPPLHLLNFCQNSFWKLKKGK